jgi:hypothetical protein
MNLIETIFLGLCFMVIFFLGAYTGQKDKICPTLQLNPEAAFILQSVEKDTLLQSYILSPTFRERTRQSLKEFNKKHPQK